MKRVLSVVLALTVMAGAVFTGGVIARSETSTVWTGSTAAPADKGDGIYEVSTPEQLAHIIYNGGGEGNTYKLTADIYLNDIKSVSWSDGTVAEGKSPKSWYGQWDVKSGFLGTLDGQGHMIYGLYYAAGNPGTSASNNGYALIPYAGVGNVTIKNLGIDHSYVKGSHYSAAILGFCKNTATVSIEACFAGENCYVVGAHAAGIVGGGFGNVDIKNCYSLATAQPTISGKGIIGNIWSNKSTQTLTNCFTNASVITNYGTTNNCYAGVDDSYKGQTAKTALSGFDFNMVWMTTAGYPELRIFNDAVPEDDSVFYRAEQYRPQYHFTPYENWSGDPNGLIYYDGEYHLFYQHNPTGGYSTNWHWGHAVSTDLIHWEELDLAIFPTTVDETTTYCWSGSCIIDKNNVSGLFDETGSGMIAYYTSISGGVQQQSMAYSTDKGRTWTQYANNPIIKTADDPLNNSAFRDPNVFEYSGKYFMTLAGGPLRFYSSDNLLDWKFESGYVTDSEYLPEGAYAIGTECPDLFPLAVDGDSNNTKWVLSASGRWYTIGDFKEVNGSWAFIPDSTDTYTMNFAPDFYALQTFENTPDGKTLAVAWLNNWKYAEAVTAVNGGFNGTYSLVYEMSLKTTDNGVRLFMEPVDNYTALRGDALVSVTDTVIEEGMDPLDSVRAEQFELVANIKPADGVTEVGFKLRQGATEEFVVKYAPSTSTVTMDRTASSLKTPNEYFLDSAYAVSSYTVNKNTDGSVDLHVFVDSSTVELTVNGGEINGSMQFFPSYASIGMEAYSVGGSTVADISVYPINNIWREKNYTTEVAEEIHFDILNGTKLSIGDIVTVNTRVYPATTNEKVNWTFSNNTAEKISETDTSITFKVIDSGEVILTATAQEGSATNTVTLSVKDAWGGKDDVAPPIHIGNNIYEINTASQLAYVISTGGGEGNTYKLTRDIYLNDIAAFNWQDGTVNAGYTVNGWYSTTSDALQMFSGTLDGDGHIVYGLYYKSSWQSSGYVHQGVGLIPKSGNAVIKNIGVDYAYISGEYNAGGIIGVARFTETVLVECSFAGENCFISGQSAGGIFGGGDTNLSVLSCYSLAIIESTNAGGIAGSVWSHGNSVQTSENCYTTFSKTGISGTNCLVGITDSVKGQAAIKNFTLSEPYCQVKDGYPTLRVFADLEEGNWNGLGQSTFEGSGTQSDPYLVENANQLAFVVYSGASAYYKVINDIYINDVSKNNWQKNENLISWIWQESHASTAYYCYANQFGGTFDGNGYTVYGVWYPESTDTQVAALFPAICGGTVKNLGISNSYMYAGYTKEYAVEMGYATESDAADLTIGIVGGIVGWSHREGSSSYVSACFSDETVHLTNRSNGNLRGSGGIVGFVMNNNLNTLLSISDCWSAAEVKSTNESSANGILGGCWNGYYTATGCYSLGSRPWMIDSSDVVSKAENAYSNCYTDTSVAHESYTILTADVMMGEKALKNMQISDDVWYAVKAAGETPRHRIHGKAIGDVDENGVGATDEDVTALRTTLIGKTVYKNSDINRNGTADICDLVELTKNSNSVVIFSANGGAFSNGSSEKTVDFETGKLLSVEVPSRVQHQFVGWSLAPNGEVLDDLTCTSEMKGIIIYAVWREQTLALSSQFSDNMVLQRDKAICIYGTGKGEGTITLGDQTKTVSSDSEEWEVYFQPMSASAEPITFKTEFFGVTTEYENVVVGDVFIAGGQSNMEMTLKSTEQSGTVTANSLLRFRGFGATDWNEFTQTNVENVSAIAVLFAQNISKALDNDIPVGIITTAVGASRIDDWTHSDYCYCNEYDLANTAFSDFYDYDKGHHTLYARHIQPIEKMTTAGVLWYQGESNRGIGEAYRYLDMFKTMVNCWRTRMDDSALPFYTVQIMLFSKDTTVDTYEKAVDEYNIRIAQGEAARTMDNVTVCTMLSYEDTVRASDGLLDIHPTDKAPIAEAIANAVLSTYYNPKGENSSTPEYSGPLYDKITVNGGTATITFNHTAEGLMLTSGDAPTEFEIRDENGNWVDATATLAGNTVTVTANGITTVTGVRLGYRNRPAINLYNKLNGVYGYCASPFIWITE